MTHGCMAASYQGIYQGTVHVCVHSMSTVLESHAYQGLVPITMAVLRIKKCMQQTSLALQVAGLCEMKLLLRIRG